MADEEELAEALAAATVAIFDDERIVMDHDTVKEAAKRDHAYQRLLCRVRARD